MDADTCPGAKKVQRLMSFLVELTASIVRMRICSLT